MVTIKELLGHAHTAVTAEVYGHVRLRLEHQAIDTLSGVLSNDNGPDGPLIAATVLR